MSDFKLNIVIANMGKFKSDVPRVIGNLMLNYYKDSFQNASFGGSRWKEVNRRIKGTPEYKYPKNRGLGRRTSNILVRTGALRRAVDGSLEIVSWDKIRFNVKNDYAAYHNEGTKNIPKRQFMGYPDDLKTMVEDKFNEMSNQLWQI
jgi:phage gpG-like protein